MKNPFRKKEPTPREAFLRTFLDCIAPGVVKFEVITPSSAALIAAYGRCGNIPPAPRRRPSCGT